VPKGELEQPSPIVKREEWYVGNWPVVLQVDEVQSVSLQQLRIQWLQLNSADKQWLDI